MGNSTLHPVDKRILVFVIQDEMGFINYPGPGGTLAKVNWYPDRLNDRVKRISVQSFPLPVM